MAPNEETFLSSSRSPWDLYDLIHLEGDLFHQSSAFWKSGIYGTCHLGLLSNQKKRETGSPGGELPHHRAGDPTGHSKLLAGVTSPPPWLQRDPLTWAINSFYMAKVRRDTSYPHRLQVPLHLHLMGLSDWWRSLVCFLMSWTLPHAVPSQKLLDLWYRAQTAPFKISCLLCIE